MRLADFLSQACRQLDTAGIQTARLDTLVLLEDVSNLNRAQLLAQLDLELTNEQINELQPKLDRRSRHEPLAYIRGKMEFYGREFGVNNHVLVPRPESEAIIELLLPLKPASVLDVGTGSGCLAITAALELPGCQVTGSDIDADCLDLAKSNAQQLGASVKFRQSDLLTDATPADVIIANLPYVPTAYPINQAAQHEPATALFAGDDGLDLYRRLFSELSWQPLHILTEALPAQHPALQDLAGQAGYQLVQTKDFIQHFSR